MAQFSKIDQLYQYNKTLNILKPRDQKWSSKYEESLYKSYVNHLFSIKFSLIDSIECTVFLLCRANMWMFTKVMYSIGIPNILPSYFRTWLHRLLIIVFLVTYRLNIYVVTFLQKLLSFLMKIYYTTIAGFEFSQNNNP